MNSRHLRRAAITLAACAWSVFWLQPASAQPRKPDLEAVKADVEFAKKLTEFIKTFESELPDHARETHGAMKQLLSERALDLLQFAKLPEKNGLLTAEQIDILKLVIDSYPDTEARRIAVLAMEDHLRLADEPAAQKMFDAIGLKSLDDELTADQIEQLKELRTKHPDSAAAQRAAVYESRQYRRGADKVLAELVKDFVKTPGAREALDRLAEKRLEFALSVVESQQVEMLSELILSFPNSPAAKTATLKIAEVRQRIAQRQRQVKREAAESKRVREHWDKIYPQRTLKYPLPAKPMSEQLPPAPAQ